MKSIGFLLPIYGIKPVGGIKVVLEYANRLAKDGYIVHIFYPMNVDTNIVVGVKFLKRLFGYLYFKVTKKYVANSWFHVEKKVNQHLVWNLSEKNTKYLDCYVATGVQTLFELKKYKFSDMSKNIYLIQGFEDWVYSKENVYESYRVNIQKVVIAPWLFDIVNEYDKSVMLIPNGFNMEKFFIKTPIKEKNKFEIATIYHNDDVKRCTDAIAALKIVKNKIPQLHVTMFGIPQKPENLPDFFTYVCSPSQDRLRDIYNQASIYVAASRSEGMALPPAESMLCGCALICTDIGGFGLYAIDGETALINKVFDIKNMAKNIQILITNDNLRYKIAENGNKYIKQFTWDKAYLQLLSLMR